jgi:hypothetical protein
MKIEAARDVVRPLIDRANGTAISLPALRKRNEKATRFDDYLLEEYEVVRGADVETEWAYLLNRFLSDEAIRERLGARWPAVEVLLHRATWKIDIARGVERSTVPEDYSTFGTFGDGSSDPSGEGNGGFVNTDRPNVTKGENNESIEDPDERAADVRDHLAKIAADLGFSLIDFSAPAGRGRPDLETAERLDHLAGAVRELREMGYSQVEIGRELGRDKRRIAELENRK